MSAGTTRPGDGVTRCTLAALLSLLLSVPAQPQARMRVNGIVSAPRAQLEPEVESDAMYVLLAVRLAEELTTEMMARVAPSGTVMLPARKFLTFTGIRTTERGHDIIAPRTDGRPAFRLRPHAGLVDVGRLTIATSPDDLRLHDGDVYLSLAMLERLLNVSVDSDLDNATVVVRNSAHLPAVLHQSSFESVRRSTTYADAQAAAPELVPTHHSALQGDYSLQLARRSRSGRDRRSPAEWLAQLRGDVAGRIAGGTLAAAVSAGSRMPVVSEVQWALTRPTSARLTHLTLGSLDAPGPSATRVQGIRIDNHPVDMSQRRIMRIRGRERDGWQYGARLDGAWRGQQRAGDGNYEFLLPMTGDVARVDVYGWGPDGASRHDVRIVHAVPMRVQQGEWQYAVAAGRCAPGRRSWLMVDPTRACQWFADVDTRVGLSEWVVLRGGVEAAPGVVAPYVGAAAVVRGTLTLQAASTLHPSGNRNRTWSASLEPSPALSASASQSTDIAGTRSRFASLHVAPLRLDGRVAADGWLSSTLGAANRVQSARVGVSAARNDVRVELYGMRASVDGLATGPAGKGLDDRAIGMAATIAPHWLRAPHVSRSWVNMSAERSMLGDIRGTVRLDASTRWGDAEIARSLSSTTQPGRWSVTFSPRSTTARQTTTISRADVIGSDNGAGPDLLQHGVSGGAAWRAGSRRVALSTESAVNRGTVAGIAFLDLDGDGRRGALEPPVAGAQVTIANRSVSTDSAGRFHSGQMTALEMIDVVMDSTTLPSPCWRAAATQWKLRTINGGVADVELPVRRGGIVQGRIALHGSGGALPWSDGPAASTLRLVSRSSKDTYEMELFASGHFYLLAVPFGRYDVRMSEAEQRRRGIIVHPATVDVGVTASDGARDPLVCPISEVVLSVEKGSALVSAAHDTMIGAKIHPPRADARVLRDTAASVVTMTDLEGLAAFPFTPLVHPPWRTSARAMPGGSRVVTRSVRDMRTNTTPMVAHRSPWARTPMRSSLDVLSRDWALQTSAVAVTFMHIWSGEPASPAVARTRRQQPR